MEPLRSEQSKAEEKDLFEVPYGTHADSGVEASSKEKRWMYEGIKRICDVFFSAVGLVVLLPFFLLLSLIIVIDNPKAGPIYSQERVGKGGKKTFTIYKFRSMKPDADKQLPSLMMEENMNGPTFKMKGDTRITTVGRFIRKTGIDEFPQLLNVLRGEMSLVGPRPPLPREVEQYDDKTKGRLSVKPGITCYWQTKEDRNTVSFDEWVKLDLKYIKERSLWVDFKIILATFKTILRMDGM